MVRQMSMFSVVYNIEYGSDLTDTPGSVDIKLRRLPTTNNQARDRASITLQELYLDNYEVKHDPAFLLGDEFGDDYNLVGDYGEVVSYSWNF